LGAVARTLWSMLHRHGGPRTVDGLRVDAREAAHGSRHAALADERDTSIHVLRGKTRVVPDHDNHRNVDRRKDVDGHAGGRQRAQKEHSCCPAHARPKRGASAAVLTLPKYGRPRARASPPEAAAITHRALRVGGRSALTRWNGPCPFPYHAVYAPTHCSRPRTRWHSPGMAIQPRLGVLSQWRPRRRIAGCGCPVAFRLPPVTVERGSRPASRQTHFRFDGPALYREASAVGSTAHARRAVQAFHPDVVIADIGMPAEDGSALVQTSAHAMPCECPRRADRPLLLSLLESSAGA
jgi:CheY-like chemotaxis protein